VPHHHNLMVVGPAKLGSHGGKDYTKVMAISKEMEQIR
jgi:hypothetical protein